MTYVVSKKFLSRALLGAGLGLITAIVWGLANEFHLLALVLVSIGWAFSLANALLAAGLLFLSQRPRISFGIAAAALLPYPIIQYLKTLESTDRGVAMELSYFMVGAYFFSGIVMLSTMYPATRTAARGASP